MAGADAMSGPRNRIAYERGQALRAEIRAILAAHPPMAAPLTAKRIQRQLTRSPPPSLRTIWWHVAAIYAASSADRLHSPQFKLETR